jgi:uncharacterized protein with PQ loop repeat
MSQEENLHIGSYVLSILSIIFYSIVYFPQVYTTWKRKSSEGVSLWMFALWTQADCMSLIGVVLLQLNLSIIVIGWYHFLVGVAMLIFTFYFKPKKEVYDGIFVMLIPAINIVVCAVVMVYVTGVQAIAGDVFGWLTATIYILGRLPQIHLDYVRKSTDGLNIWMYIFTILGNLLYTASVLTYSIELSYLRLNLPWLILTGVTVLLDFVVVGQHVYYNKDPKPDVEVGL